MAGSSTALWASADRGETAIIVARAKDVRTETTAARIPQAHRRLHRGTGAVGFGGFRNHHDDALWWVFHSPSATKSVPVRRHHDLVGMTGIADAVRGVRPAITALPVRQMAGAGRWVGLTEHDTVGTQFAREHGIMTADQATSTGDAMGFDGGSAATDPRFR